MGLCKSKLPQMGRPQEKGNIAGVAGLLGGMEGDCAGQESTGTNPSPSFLPGHCRHPQVPPIIFVMGGPGCGKETQCKNMATKYGFCHVGLGQLLWQEAQQGTQRGQKIHDIMLQGLLVPTGVILDMISGHMLSCPDSQGFLIDGFPQELRQAKEFEHIVSDPNACEGYKVGRAPNLVIVFDCSVEAMVQRELRRGQVECRADDCKLAIRQCLEVHYTLCQPILAFYQQNSGPQFPQYTC
ncbi:adenylate kinase isoenzyme 1-like [Eubalaena glacialis]|uniref:adenylate kinase isoenzyme 1-like n=1 Tax=Eubalaena glacialis TaxID=27606 RepID=UPI002A5AFE9A|nr:adenylate kinase isoenzyme 1-like [Eubalaena glacialis]